MTVKVDYENFYDTLITLINLLESRQIEASQVNVSEVIKVYASYLLRSEKMSLSEIAEFLTKAATLVLSKVRALFPQTADEIGEEDKEEDVTLDASGTPSSTSLHPFRVAAIYLEILSYRRSKHFTRQVEEVRPLYEVGDLYFLASLWWSLINKFNSKTKPSAQDMVNLLIKEDPEETIEARIEDIKNSLSRRKELTLLELLKDKTGKSFVVSTIVALLELARIGIIYLNQKQQFGDIYVKLKE
ncbi:MAG: segregation/condensation protein A [Acetomicrobium sp.]